MAKPARSRHRGLTKEAIVARALELGDAEGLDAVSVRRLAADLDVTPMALYRHVRDKQDLINAMTEKVMEGFDLSAGFRRSMTWNERIRRAMANYKEQMNARPLALALSIAYSGEGPAGFWRMTELLLGILLQAGFSRRQAIVLIRVISTLLSGYLLLLSQNRPEGQGELDARQLELLRKRVEQVQLSLPADEFPNIVSNAHDMAELWLTSPDRWWRDTLDLIVFGLERMLERSPSRPRADRGRGRP